MSLALVSLQLGAPPGCRIKSDTSQQICACICWVGLLEVFIFFKNVPILHLMGENTLASVINEN